jgi:hypothetical protein
MSEELAETLPATPRDAARQIAAELIARYPGLRFFPEYPLSLAWHVISDANCHIEPHEVMRLMRKDTAMQAMAQALYHAIGSCRNCRKRLDE